MYKFQKLRVYQLALDYLDMLYEISNRLPLEERYNLRSQIERAGVSIALNIAEGSTSRTDGEQARFLSMAIRSYMETVACTDIIARRPYGKEIAVEHTLETGHDLFVRLQAFRRRLRVSC